MIVPVREENEEGPFSSVTERGDGALSPNLTDTDSPGLDTIHDPLIAAAGIVHPLLNLEASPVRAAVTTRSASSSVSLVLSPPSPTRQRFDSHDRQRHPSGSSGSPENNHRDGSYSRQPRSPDFLNDGRPDRPRVLGGSSKPAPRRRTPPPPCSIELPTFEDLNFGENLNSRTSHDSTRTSAVVGLDALSAGRHSTDRRKTPSPKMDSSILPLSNSRLNDSRTSLVGSQSMASISSDLETSQHSFTSIDGLGISSPLDSTFDQDATTHVNNMDQQTIVEIDANVKLGQRGKSPVLKSDLPYGSLIGR